MEQAASWGRNSKNLNFLFYSLIMANTPFKMKGSPMQRNFGIGSPVKDKYVSSKELIAESGKQEKKKKPTLGEWWKGTKLGKDLKALGTRMQDTAANIQHSTPESRSKTVRKGFETASRLWSRMLNVSCGVLHPCAKRL
jgi:hypothetical protein